MRRIVAVALVLVPLLAAAVWAVYLAGTSAGPVTGLEDAGLVGPVYIIVERTYSFEPGDESMTEDSLIDKTMKTFDRNGNVTESIVYGLNDFVAKKTTFEYDQNGYVREMVFFSPDGNTKSRGVSEYDPERNISIMNVYDADDVFQYSGEAIYDDRGILVETRRFTEDGQLFDRVVYRFDDAGRQVGEDAYDRSGLVVTRVSEFAANGQVSRTESYHPDGTPWYCRDWTDELLYDDVGNWVRRETTGIDCLEGRSREEMMTVKIREITYYD